MDTVPPYFPARIDNERLYGRGACDTKSLLASLLLAGQKLVDEGNEDVSFLFVVSEETDHSGMKKANELKLDPEAMIVAEPTVSKLIRLQKGILKVNLVKKGVSAHSGYPHLGKSAIDPLIDVLADLKREKWPSSEELGDTTLNIGVIKGGQAANAVPEYAEALLMFRVISDPEKVLQRVKEIVKGRVEVLPLTSNSPVHLGVVDGFDVGIASFNTDIPYFTFGERKGTAFLYGPGDICDAHCPREQIRLDELRASVGEYYRLAKSVLSRKRKRGKSE